MGYEFFIFTAGGALLTHQDMSQLAENDNFFATAWGNYRRPNLIYVNSQVVSVEENTGVDNQSKVFDEDGDVFFSEGSTISQARGCDLTRPLNFATATPQGGLVPTYTLTANTWYHIYAVKCTDSSQLGNFVLGATEAAPMRGNAGTLFSEFGIFGSVYLGTIRYGDSLSNPAVILDFVQACGLTLFKNTITGNSGRPSTGIQLATGTSLGSLTYTYAQGGGDLQIPANIDNALYCPSFEDSNNQNNVRDQPANIPFARSNGGMQKHFDIPATFGLQAQNIGSNGIDIFLAGFRDGYFQPDHNKLYW